MEKLLRNVSVTRLVNTSFRNLLTSFITPGDTKMQLTAVYGLQVIHTYMKSQQTLGNLFLFQPFHEDRWCYLELFLRQQAQQNFLNLEFLLELSQNLLDFLVLL